MAVLNSSMAGALGRPDLVFAVQSGGQMYSGAPTVVAGGSSSLLNGANAGPSGIYGSGGRSALIVLMALLGAYAAFTWWVRPHLA